jgi:hypothetical protein
LGRAAFHLSRKDYWICTSSQAAMVVVEVYRTGDQSPSLARKSAWLLPGMLVWEGVYMVKKIQRWCISSRAVVRASCANW